MKTRFTILTLACAAFAALMLTAAPVPQASAIPPQHGHADDPCEYTRQHQDDNSDFALWEAFCDDTVQELHLRSLSADARCGRYARTAIHEIRRFCRHHCRNCSSNCRKIPQRAKTKARIGKFNVAKCVWDAQMDYDDIYNNARAQLEAAGYACLVQKLYIKFQYVNTHSVRFQRRANNAIEGATRNCRCP